LYAILFGLLSGCAGRREEHVRLVVISPHRDEVREEVRLAFLEWFQERTEKQAAAVQEALQAWLAHQIAKRIETVDRAVADLCADWRPDELGGLRDSYQTWRKQPSREHSQALLASLAEWRNSVPTIEIVWQDIGGGTSQIARYVAARYESSPDGIGIDLLFGGGTDIYLRFADQGRLQKIEMPPSILRRIRPQLGGLPLYDPEGRWYGPMLTSFGILYNRTVLNRIGRPEPRRWADLGQPGLAGWVSAGDPRITGSVHMVYEIILQGHGWDKGFRRLLRLGANAHGFIRDSGTLTRTVTSGEVAAAGNLDANALTAVGRDPQMLGFCLPDGETIINPDAIAVLKGAPRKELARAFVEFTLSDAGQRLFLLRPGEPGGPRRHPLCRLSVVEELYSRYPPERRSVAAANPFRAGDMISYNSKLGNSRWDALNDLIGAAIVDAHADLRAAWRRVLAMTWSSARDGLEEELFAPPCSAEELAAHARAIAEQGPRVRTATVNRWGETARRHYRDIRRRAAAAR
jgi:ABC-type Fe3+ transport system substrate-binding protein